MAKPPRGLSPDQRKSESRATRGIMQNAVDLPGVQSGAGRLQARLRRSRGIGFRRISSRQPAARRLSSRVGGVRARRDKARIRGGLPLQETARGLPRRAPRAAPKSRRSRRRGGLFPDAGQRQGAQVRAKRNSTAKAWALVASTRSKPPCGKARSGRRRFPATGATTGRCPSAEGVFAPSAPPDPQGASQAAA